MSLFDEAYHERPLLFGTNATEELLYVIDTYKISGRALELGCGDGRDTKYVLNRGFTVTAIEQSKWALNTLINRDDISLEEKSRLKIVNSDVMEFSYDEDSFDFIYAITLFDHLAECNCYELLNKVIRSLKLGGFLFLKVHTVDDVGNTKAAREISEFVTEIKHFFGRNELLSKLLPLGRVIYYLESMEDDFDHGLPHTHAFASLLLKKETIK